MQRVPGRACTALGSAGHAGHTLHPDLAVTISMGIADDLRPDSPGLLMALVDKRLSHAKHAGKNQVVLGP